MTLEDFKIVVKKAGEWIEFVPVTQNYGLAGFLFCVKRRRSGYISDIYIQPRQQNITKVVYHFPVEIKTKTLYFSSGLDTDEAKMRDFTYCNDHKCTAFYLNVPRNAKALYFRYALGMVQAEFHHEVKEYWT